MRPAAVARNGASRGWLFDVLLSCSVYLIPLVTAHTLTFLGEYLVGSARRRSTHAPGWVISELAVALAAQLAMLLVLRLSRRRSRGVRAAVIAGGLIALTPAVNAVLLVGLPTRYLTEVSTAPAHNSLNEICRVPDVDLVPGVTMVFAQSERSALIVRRHDDQGFASVEVPGCAVSPLDVPSTADIVSASATAVLWTPRNPTGGRRSEWFVTSFRGSTTRRVDGTDVPAGRAPRLLDDEAGTVGWLERGTATELVLLNATATRRVPVPLLPFGSAVLLAGSGPSGPFRVSVMGAGPQQWITVDGTGRVLSSMDAPDTVSRFSHELLTHPAGWTAWDTYVEDRAYRIAWSRDGRAVHRVLSKGLAFTSVALDASGEFIAVSATSGLNIGAQRDEVWLLRTTDGAELFRRYSPKYSRAIVALPSGRFFAVGEIADGRPALRIHALPVRP